MPRGLYNPYEHAAGPSRSTARQTTDINAARSHAYQYPSPVDSNSSRGRMDYGLGNTPGQARSSRSGSTTTPPELGRNELASHCMCRYTSIELRLIPRLQFLCTSRCVTLTSTSSWQTTLPD